MTWFTNGAGVMVVNPDPTMSLLHSLRTDRAKWVKTRLAAFVPHERTVTERRGADGSVTRPAATIKVTEADLRDEADRANERTRDTGRLDTLTIGHRKFDPDARETDQPPLAGFCLDYAVEWVEREGGRFLALTYDEYAARDRAAEYDLYRQYPFRSAEYHPDLGITGVAALVRPPALNMGTVYVYSAEPVPMDPTAETTPAADPDGYETFCRNMQRYTAEQAAATTQAPADPAATETFAAKPGAKTTQVPAVPVTYAADLAALRKQVDDEKAARLADKKAAVEQQARGMLDAIKDARKFDYDRELGVMVTYAADADRTAHVTYMLDTYERLTTDPALNRIRTAPPPGAKQPAAPATPAGLTPLQRAMTAPGSLIDRELPAAARQLRTPAPAAK